MSVKTFSVKINTELLELFTEVCKRKNLIKAKILEEAIRNRLEEMAEEEWAISMITERAASKTMSLAEFEKKIKKGASDAH